jgi:hypothetical protein
VGSSAVPVTVGAIPFVSAIAPTTICTGDSLILNASVQNGQSPYSWSWNPPNALNNPFLQNPTSGAVTTTTYVVTVTDANGCKDDTTTIVYLQTVPSVALDSVWSSKLTCNGYVILLKANGSSNEQSMYWSFGDGTYTTTYPPNDTVTHSYPFNGTYSVVVTVSNPPCKSTRDTILNIGDINSGLGFCAANVFTPNGTGPTENECFHPAFLNSACGCKLPCSFSPPSSDVVDLLLQCITLEVYDRWGIKMFESSDSKKCWDGTTRDGTPAKEGTYYYISKFGEVTLKGFVELLR